MDCFPSGHRRRPVSALALLAALAALFLPASPLAAQTHPAPKDDGVILTEDNEVKLGRENAEENDKQVKLITSAAIVERVNRIGQEIAAVANTVPMPAHYGSSQLKQFQYTFKVVDDKDVNAYSLPGGFIYVDKGLLDYVHSDDELAGVLAHEVTHAAHHHMVKLMHEQHKIQNVLLPLLLAAIATTHPGYGGTMQLLMASNLYTVAKLNSYSVDAEKDADRGGIILLTHTRYNPIGLYSVMLRFAADENSHIHGDLGVFRTHPPSQERVDATQELLAELKLPIHLSEVDPNLKASISDVKDAVTGASLSEVRMQGILMCRVASDEVSTSRERAGRLASRLTTLVDSHLQSFEIRVSHDQKAILARGQPLLTGTDAAAQRLTMSDLCRSLSDAINEINQRQQIRTVINH